MRFGLLLPLIASAAFGQGRVFDRACDVASRRSSRGGVACGVSYPAPPAFPTPPSALFYAFPNGNADGGMGFGSGALECSGQQLVDVSQNSVKYVRSGAVVGCVREIDGLGVELQAQEPFVIRSPTYSNHQGPLLEDPQTNYFKSSYDLNNPDGGSAWVNVATVTANVWPGPFSHYRTNSGFEQLSDASGAADQCSTQTVIDTTVGSKAISCTFRSGTLTTARIKIVGAGNGAGDRTCTFTGLDTVLSRNDRRGCVTPAYTGAVTSVAVSVCPGSAVGDTGTIGVVDCQYEKNDHITSYIPTTTTTAARLGSSASAPTTPATLTLSDTKGCSASDLYVFKYDAETFWSLITVGVGGSRGPFCPDDTHAKTYDGTNQPSLAITSLYNSTVQASAMWAADGGLSIWVQDAGIATSAYDGTMFGTSISADAFAMEGTAGLKDGMLSNVILDSEDNLCRVQAAMGNIDRIGWVGDSQSSTRAGISQTVPACFFQRTSTNGTSFAAPGSTFVSTIAAQWTANGNGTYNKLVVHGGVNDVILNGTSGATLYAAELAFVEEWAYRGVQVYWLDMLPFGGYDSTASFLTARNDFNTAQATYCLSPALNVHCIANSSLVWDPANHDNQLASLSIDGLHLNQAGNNIACAHDVASFP